MNIYSDILFLYFVATKIVFLFDLLYKMTFFLFNAQINIRDIKYRYQNAIIV